MKEIIDLADLFGALGLKKTSLLFWVIALFSSEIYDIRLGRYKIRKEDVFREIEEHYMLETMPKSPRTRDEFLFWSWVDKHYDLLDYPSWDFRLNMLKYHYKKIKKIGEE